MKTTLEIPGTIFRRAKSKAVELSMPFRQFVTNAVEDKLKATIVGAHKSWMKHLGKLKDLREETRRINGVIGEAFEEIDSEGAPSALRRNAPNVRKGIIAKRTLLTCGDSAI